MNRNIYILIVLFLKSFCAQDIIETVEAVVGHSAELPCNATAEKEDDKLTILAWYKNNSSAAFYSRDLREGGQVTSSANSGRYRLLTADYDGLDKLEIITVRPSDAGLYQCLADFATSPAHKTYVQLFVIEPPRLLWVVHENGTEVAKASAGVNVSRNVGPYYVGETVHLFCVAFGGKPQATLSWWSEQRLLKNTSTPLSEHRVRSDIMYGTLRREDHGRILTCYAQNNDKTAPLSVDVTINMYLPPELVSLRVEDAGTDGSLERARGRVRAGETLKLQCRVLGARPPPTLIWRLNESHLVNLEQNITKEPSQRLVVSDIQLSVSEEHDESRITCCAAAYQRDNDSFICAQGLPLTVLYPPVLKIEVEADVDNNTLTVVKGSDVSLACNYKANPSVYQLIWFHEDDILSNDNDDIQAILELVNVKESDSGEYGCAATNSEGSSYSQTLVIDVTYPSYCEDNATVEYGVGENESINLTCNVKGNPEPSAYRWIIVYGEANVSTLRSQPHTTVDTLTNTLQFQRPNNTDNTIFCWGINNVPSKGSPHTPCSFIVTDETTPRPPMNCEAAMTTSREIIVKCEKGHDGGLPQKFKFIVKETESDEHLVSIINLEPEFVIPEPKQENFKFVVIAFNDKGESTAVDIEKEDIIIGYKAESSVPIATLTLSLCGGVALLALAACGLVLCTAERADARDHGARDAQDPPLCAYNTDESNCETYHDSDDGSEYNVRRTDSFRKAVSKYPSKNFDVRRTSSMHSARYMHDVEPEVANKCHEIRRNPNCRVHSLQNINRKREMDAFCDHFVLHLPPDNNYNTPRPMNTFYTMPRKMRHKLAKELSDENSEITQTSDGFSLPPPPDEFGTYRAATRIRDIPKSSPTYTTVIRKNSTGKDPTKYHQYSNQVLAPMNTVGLPTISGAQGSVYTYPDDDHHGHQVNTNPFEEDSS